MNASDAKTTVRVVAVMTAHNRRALTLASLERLEVAARVAGVTVAAVLMDDGSTDGTAEAVRQRHPWVEVLVGQGDLFWNRGMHAAQAQAMRHAFDYLLWLNDDTALHDDALARLLATHATLERAGGAPSIVVGATSDRGTGQLSYGGLVARRRWRPFNYCRVWSETEAVDCQAMNGNIVLIPRVVAEKVGNLDPVFEHGLGDIDYALRARRCGFRVVAAPGVAGSCSNNPVAGTFRDPALPFAERWKRMRSRKGLPPRSWWHFTRRHGGPAGLAYFAWPYVRLVVEAAIGSVRRQPSRI